MSRLVALRALITIAVLACLSGCAPSGPSTATTAVAVATSPPASTASPAPPTTAQPLPATTTPASTARAGTTTSRAAPAPGCNALAVVATWTLPRRAAQLVVVPAEEDDVATAAPAIRAGAGGLILFGSSAPVRLGAQLAALRALAPHRIAPLVMTDEEGGGVQRMANLVGNLPWPRTMAATMTPGQVRRLAAQVGRRMHAAGITMDLAPVLDLSDGPGPDAAHPDGARSFSLDPRAATAYGLAFARGLADAGVIPVVKHFPGLGQASYNTDLGPAHTPSLATLRRAALVPFESAIAAQLPAVMVGNVTVPGLTTLPASLSHAAVTGLLRDQLGFHGLVLTDSLSAGAISAAGYSAVAAAPRAIAAGADMVLFDSSDPSATTAAMVAAIVTAARSGALSRARLDAAVANVLAAKGVSLCK